MNSTALILALSFFPSPGSEEGSSLPPVEVEDLGRFPPPEVVILQLRFHYQHWEYGICKENHWKPELEVWEGCSYQEWYLEMYERWYPWLHLQAAQSAMKAGNMKAVLNDLNMLRMDLGAKAYWEGVMPNSTPVWMFRRMEPR
jgi:hypothetical protein